MHLRDGILTPEICLIGGTAAVAAVGYSLRRVKAELSDRAAPLTGMVAAFIFAGQMVNFPLFGLPVSGHLLGGVLAATIVGPWAGCLALTLVLIVQALLFADGGLLCLGINVWNMAVVGCWCGGGLYAVLRRVLGTGPRGSLFAATLAAYLSVLLSAACFSAEFALAHGRSGFDLRQITVWMLAYHALIGIGEAALTGSLVAFLLARRPEVILTPARVPERQFSWRPVIVGGAIAAFLIAAFAAPWASEYADGLEAVAERFGFGELGVDRPLVLSDYAVPLPTGWDVASVSLAGVLGTLVVLVIGWGLSRWLAPSIEVPQPSVEA